MKGERLGEEYRAEYTIVHEELTYRLRHYPTQATSALGPLLFVPPLMVTAEVYDISEELSSVAFLRDHGVDVWLVDFGAPETEAGGLERTLDDHVRAVSQAVDRVYRKTGRDVHLAGYSQGGMFAYQAAAYRRSSRLASVITFGSPVDIRATVPFVDDDILERLVRSLTTAIASPLQQIEQLPGFLTSNAFKLLSVRKELQQYVELVATLHDRQALLKRESRRRFLGGEGFVAWPGPAFRGFIDEFIVNNRMTSGGFVIDGRTVTLSDITVPILYFLGTRDELARPAAVRGIKRASPRAEQHELPIRAGHFGLVVGRTSMEITWPTVVEWVRYVEGQGELPVRLAPGTPEATPSNFEDIEDAPLEDIRIDFKVFYNTLMDVGSAIRSGARELGREMTDALDTFQFQLPRLTQMRKLEPESLTSIGRSLTEQAHALPNQSFFLHKGRSFSYRDADRRVTYVVHGLWASGIRPGMRVGVYMANRPSYLTMVAALSRMGAVAVLMGPDMKRLPVREAVRMVSIDALVADPERAASARRAYHGPVLVLGGGGKKRALGVDVIDMEAIDPESIDLPPEFEPDQGRASDPALVFFSSDHRGRVQPATITNGRWALASLATAAAARFTTADTVYCTLPLYHPMGLLLAVSGALVGGARLALEERFDPDSFWTDVHRYGATVTVYAGDMCRQIANRADDALARNNSLRLFVGTGMAPDVWRKVVERFGPVDVLEFYASVASDAVLVNRRGQPIGAIGRPLKGTARIELVDFDPTTGGVVRGEDGRAFRVRTGQPGLLVAAVDRDREHFRCSTESTSVDAYESNLFVDGDEYRVTGDVLRRDDRGDFYFVERAVDLCVLAGKVIAPSQIEHALEACAGVAEAVVLQRKMDGTPVLEVLIVPEANAPVTLPELTEAIRQIEPEYAVPDVLRIVESIPRTDTFRASRGELLKRAPAIAGDAWSGFWWDSENREARVYDGRSRKRLVRQLQARRG
jgi:putative long chain acyl-CoA synthase